MAELKMSISSPSSVSDMTLLARALSKLSHAESLDSQPNAIRNFTPHGSRRKFSSSNSLNESLDSIIASCSEARVLIINTGGTIGMKIQDDVLAPTPNAFVKALRKLATFHDEQYAQQTGMYDFYDAPEKTLVLPNPSSHAEELFRRYCSTGGIVCVSSML